MNTFQIDYKIKFLLPNSLKRYFQIGRSIRGSFFKQMKTCCMDQTNTADPSLN